MPTIYARRTERIAIRRNVQLVCRTESGKAEQIPATTFSVSCHGAGFFAGVGQGLPLGKEVLLLDQVAGVGVWGRLVWEGAKLRDGRQMLAMEFRKPRNYWGQRLVPRSWTPYLSARCDQPSQPGAPAEDDAQSDSGETCRCCGNPQGVVLDEMDEPICKICLDWVA